MKVFKTIESDITRSGQALSIFGKEARNVYRDFASAVNGIKTKTGGISQFSISRILGNKLSKQDIQALRNYNNEIKKYNEMTDDAVTPQTAFYRCLGNSSAAAQKLARDANGAAVSEETLTAATNQLTFAQKAANIATKALVKGLNLIGNIAFAMAINAIITKVYEFVNREKELAEQAKESAQTVEEESKALEELKQKYIEICDSTDDEATKVKNLNELKQTLIDTYGLTEEALHNLNLEREKGIDYLENEIKLANQASRGEWLGNNKEAIEKADKKIKYQGLVSESTDGVIKSMVLSNGHINLDNISSSIKDMFADISYETSGILSNTSFKVAGDDMIERYEKIQEIISQLGNMTERTDEEELLLDLLNKESSSMKEILDIYQSTYETKNKYVSANLFDEYNALNNIKDVGKDSYISWRDGLLSTANGDKALEKELLALAEQQFPDYAKYFNNLEKAKSNFIKDEYDNNLKNQIYSYISSLNEDDLSILLTFDTNAFDEGIEAVKRKIAETKIENPVEVNFKISDYQEQIESVYGNIEKLQDAITKLNENKFDFSGDIQDLIKAFPEYSTEILNASGDTEQLRKVLQELLNSQPNDLIKSLTELKGSLTSDEDIKAVDNLINILRNSTSVAYSVTSLSDSLQDLSDKESILSTVWKEMNDNGHISVSTYKSLCDMGEDFANIVSIVDGKLTLNIDALKELTKKKYEDEIATLRLTRAEEWHNAIIAGKNGEDTSKYTAIIDNIDAEIEAKKKVLELYENYDYKSEGSSGSDDDTPNSVKNFETELAKRQHEINLGLRKEDASYYDWLEQAAHKAYDGLADYEDDLWKYEEQVYEWRKDHEQDLFDQKIENLDKEKEKALENNDFDTAKTSVNTQITETKKRIVELKTSGKQDVDDEIKQLEEDLDNFNDDLKDISSQEYEFKVSVVTDNVDEQIEALDRSIENTGDTKLYSEKIKVYKDSQQQILDMIKFYRKQGYAEDSAIIKELKKQWNDYQDSISDALQEQANAQVEAYNELLEEQKELLEQQKEAQDEYYDSEIKALEDKKEALEKVNETIEEQNELEEKRQAIAEAERNLYKNVRLVYSGGQWVQKAREEDLQAVKDAENDLSDTLRKQEIEALENQITALNDAKDEYDEAIDKQITAIEESEKAFEKAMENSYKVRQQLDYEFISAIVGDDKAKEYQTNADNALKAIAEAEKTDNTDNSALIDSNNTVAETNREVAESNLQKLSADDALKSIYNSFQKSGALLKGTTFEKFAGNIQNSILNATLNTAPKIADDVIKGSMVNNYMVNNNHPVINTTVNIEGRNKSDEEIANIVANTAESKVTQALTAFVQGATNRYTKMMYGNT